MPKVFLTTLNILTTSASIATSAFTAMAVPWRPVIFYSKWIRKYTIFPWLPHSKCVTGDHKHLTSIALTTASALALLFT